MDRREAIKKLIDQSTALAGSAMLVGCSSHSHLTFDQWGPIQTPKEHGHKEHGHTCQKLDPQLHNQIEKIKNHASETLKSEGQASYSKLVHNQDEKTQHKMENFDQDHPGDIILGPERKATFLSCYRKLQQLYRYIGYGNFNLVSFEEFIAYSKTAPRLEALSPVELKFLEEIFYFSAEKYGFYGKKLQTNITDKIPSKEVIKIPFSGHYLYRDVSYPIYQKIKKDVGRSIILTSGVRGVVKQLHLFFAKTIKSDFNLSQASRSLAPPGYSYHSVGDFDIGKKGLGTFNFTNKFSQTDEYKKLIDLGYIDIRYPTDNPFGVRFEPWHIEGKFRRV
ncbi:MAG: D-alanyl-D-alanine carboxypeptidase family protein [Oligoflexales bacterium]|nr:D-alanyl-D-alanine carboxypeptidase family protein [Oligoflexales bacterium]